MRFIWLAGGWIALGLGLIGAVLPLLPTTPFLLLAAFCFARSSQRVHDWLVEHPKLGPPIADWRRSGAIRPRLKWVATASMGLSIGIPMALGAPLWVLGVQALALTCVGVFIWTRPDE